MSQSISYIQRYWCYVKDFDKVSYLPFENIKVPVPDSYDVILSHMYGKYMEYPPVEKRGLWHNGELFLDPDIPYKEYMKKEINK